MDDSLILFRRQFEELREHKLLFDRTHAIRGGFRADGPEMIVNTAIDGYDNDVFKSFLITFRQFTLAKESVFFYSVCNTLWKWGHTHARTDVKMVVEDARDCWRRIWNEKGAISIGSNGVEINKVSFFDILINGWLAHSDKEKSDLYHSLPDFCRLPLYSELQNMLGRLYLCLNNCYLVAVMILDNTGKTFKVQSTNKAESAQQGDAPEPATNADPASRPPSAPAR